MANVPAYTWTEYLPNISLNCYRYTTLLHTRTDILNNGNTPDTLK
jgi:hypothetical protein